MIQGAQVVGVAVGLAAELFAAELFTATELVEAAEAETVAELAKRGLGAADEVAWVARADVVLVGDPHGFAVGEPVSEPLVEPVGVGWAELEPGPEPEPVGVGLALGEPELEPERVPPLPPAVEPPEPDPAEAPLGEGRPCEPLGVLLDRVTAGFRFGGRLDTGGRTLVTSATTGSRLSSTEEAPLRYAVPHASTVFRYGAEWL